ncbi:LysM peptidoglycan-binding domain-containing protein [Microbacterium sp. NPDC055910]|uniref:muramidase family protein n=1 Tax=Microbacterium sp. NPDC055910 TaxID=3345659 RepID=UPI0035DE3CA1
MDTAVKPLRDPRPLVVPVAVAGSLAVILSSTPAAAVERSSEHSSSPSTRTLPASALPAARSAAVAPPTHTVTAGDTVSGIASRHGLRTDDVLALNGLTWNSVIQPGQVLRLSGGAAPAPTTPHGTYVVQAGDTIVGIAARHAVTTQAMLTANRLDWSSIIYPGQKLSLPGAAPAPAAPAPTPAPAPAPAPAGSHTVIGGDTITSIAAHHGVSVQGMLDANGLDRSAIIYPGQQLALPGAPVLAASVSAVVAGLDAEQTANARIIVQVGRELGVPDRGIAIALGTAMVESWIRNLDWGDRDSLGLFQQRPSMGWGTAEQIRDPHRAARVFYGGAHDPNGSATRGLLDIPGWQDMTFADAAQAVQISAFPDRYALWEQPAYAWLAALG